MQQKSSVSMLSTWMNCMAIMIIINEVVKLLAVNDLHRSCVMLIGLSNCGRLSLTITSLGPDLWVRSWLRSVGQICGLDLCPYLNYGTWPRDLCLYLFVFLLFFCHSVCYMLPSFQISLLKTCCKNLNDYFIISLVCF